MGVMKRNHWYEHVSESGTRVMDVVVGVVVRSCATDDDGAAGMWCMTFVPDVCLHLDPDGRAFIGRTTTTFVE